MLHRVRFAMTDKAPILLQGTIEADETCVGGKVRGSREWRMKRDLNTRMKEAWDKEVPVFGIKERAGRVRAGVIRKVQTDAIERAVWSGVDRDSSRMMGDEHPVYRNLSKMPPHDVIRHKSEYVRGEVHRRGIILGTAQARPHRDVSPSGRGVSESVRGRVRVPAQHAPHNR